MLSRLYSTLGVKQCSGKAVGMMDVKEQDKQWLERAIEEARSSSAAQKRFLHYIKLLDEQLDTFWREQEITNKKTAAIADKHLRTPYR